ncbi:MAG TPA: protein kinase, partial [Kofleriaceae bacterium]|nr:protein kinase [Kofleriaceae bacterium]
MTAIADEGVSLLTIVGESGRRRLDELGVARVIAEVAEALDLSTVLAQPITPANIVILRTGTVRLDGKSIGPDEEIAYTAPERLRGESGDHRSDVFSLGVVMWEALTHERLFEGLTEDAIKEAVLADEVSAPSTRNANIPAELDVICLRALARDPASRYPTAKAMAVEVEGVLRDASYGRNNEAIGAFVSALPKELFRKVVPARPSLPAPKVAPKIGTHTMIGIPQPKPPAETVPMPGLNQSVPTVQLAPLSETAPGLVTPVLKPPAEVAKVVESAKGVPALDAPPPAKSTDTVMGIGRLVEAIPDDPIQP